MKTFSSELAHLSLILVIGFTAGTVPAQSAADIPPFDEPPAFGSGGPGPAMQKDLKLVAQFDRDGNGRLDAEERKAARAVAIQKRSARPQGGPMSRPPRRVEANAAPQAGLKISLDQVAPIMGKSLYDAATLRTFFLEFENSDWEQELADFHGTDVEVPAKLIVDGKIYPNVGVHFRGLSSFMMVSEGHKRSLNVAVDFASEEQRLLGYRTLNLLNSHEDPTFLRTVLYFDIARNYLPAPQANFSRVVINGESWGIYVNVEQFNKDFLKEWFGTTKGARWKVPGSPAGRGGLEYLGEDAAAYKTIYEIKSKDEPKVWADLIRLCRVLNETPAEKLEAALAPLLDIDGALRFLALENVLINNDGYWIRASDYSIYQDVKGQFHLIPHDANETFSLPGGPGPGRPRGGAGNAERGGKPGNLGGVELDPLTGLNDARKPLRSKLLAVPALRSRYLGYVREIAELWLDWSKLGPRVASFQQLLAAEVQADTRKLDSSDSFFTGATNSVSGAVGGFRGSPQISLKAFAEGRRAYLLALPAVRAAQLPGATRAAQGATPGS